MVVTQQKHVNFKSVKHGHDVGGKIVLRNCVQGNVLGYPLDIPTS